MLSRKARCFSAIEGACVSPRRRLGSFRDPRTQCLGRIVFTTSLEDFVTTKTTSLAVFVGSGLCASLVMALMAGAAGENPRQERGVAVSMRPPGPPSEVRCCDAAGCVDGPPEGCGFQADAPLDVASAVDAYASRALVTTRPRMRRVAWTDLPNADAPLGDHMAALFDLEGVTDVVVGTVVEETAYLLGPDESMPVTRCRMMVEKRFKGDPVDEISFHTIGAKVNGFYGYASHSPSCAYGDVALVFVGPLGPVNFALGSNETYVALGEWREGQTRWAGHVVAFVQQLELEAP